MNAYRSSLFCSALAAILAPRGVEKMVVAEQRKTVKRHRPLVSSNSAETSASQVDGFDFAVDFGALAPEPVFDDLSIAPRAEVNDQDENGGDIVAKEALRTTYLVEVYENEARDFRLKWRQPRWSYKVRSSTVVESCRCRSLSGAREKLAQ